MEWMSEAFARHCQVMMWEKRNPHPNFWSEYLWVGWGSSTWRGGGQKVRYVPPNPREPKLLAGYPRIFAGISPGCPKSLRTKKFVFNFWPWSEYPCVSEPCPANRVWKLSPHSILQTRLIGYCVRALWGVKPCLETLPAHILKRPSAGHCLDTHMEDVNGQNEPSFCGKSPWTKRKSVKHSPVNREKDYDTLWHFLACVLSIIKRHKSEEKKTT